MTSSLFIPEKSQMGQDILLLHKWHLTYIANFMTIFPKINPRGQIW